jgi:hypothetical protein
MFFNDKGEETMSKLCPGAVSILQKAAKAK